MSLDSLFQHILLTEQQVTEKHRQLHEVKTVIVKTQANIKCYTEKLEHAQTELDEKAQVQSEATLQLCLVKKRQEQMEKKKEALLQEQKQLRQELEQGRRKSAEEKEKFMKEITTFNSDFNLLSKRDDVFQSQTRAEIQSLQLQVGVLTDEMESMKQKNTWLLRVQKERRSIEAELQEMHSQLAEMERALDEAVALTDSLRAERLMVSQKPLTDRTCLRLKKELEAYKEGELELLREALCTEIQFLCSKLSQNTRC